MNHPSNRVKSIAQPDAQRVICAKRFLGAKFHEPGRWSFWREGVQYVISSEDLAAFGEQLQRTHDDWWASIQVEW